MLSITKDRVDCHKPAFLLFTPSYQNGVIKELVTEVPRDDFDVEKTGQVEIIGWLYQYYNEEARERAIGQPKSHKYSEPELASATQLFTPDWIVKYMVQNSLGKLWIHSLMAKGKGTEQDLVQKFDWQYYMPDATQNESKSQLIAATDKPLTSLVPKDIQFLDPSMGSGHILVYAFDVLMQIYLSEGYGRREAAQAVLQNNLVGLDIDSRATQLSYFAVMMKLRQFDRRALSQSEHCSPKLYTVVSSQDIPRANVQLLLAHATANEKEAVTNLLQGFAHADEYGSLTDVSSIDLALLKSAQQKVNVNQATLHTDFVRVKLSQLVQIAQILKAKFDVIVTNPPYMGTARLDTDYSAYVKKHFPRAKADLFAMFIEKFNAALKKGGYSALVTMQSWMFLSSFEKMRKHLLAHYTISNLMHMENGVMGIAFGTAVLVTRNVQSKEFVGTYHQIKSGDARMGDPQSLPIPGNRFNRTNQTNYMKIPGMRIAYWAPEHLINAFIDSRTLGSYYPIQSGMKTANNDLFTRKWWEVKFPRICFFRKSINEQSNGKWFPYNKGGYFRRWYGNRELIVNFAENGSQIQKYGEENSKSYSFQGAQHYFQEGITWTGKTSSINSFRHSPFGAIFDSNAGPMVFPGNESEERTLLGMLNSHVSAYILNMYNPTINLQNGDVGDLPIVRMDDSRAVPIVDYNIQITKNDWDDSEASWDLNKYILLTHIAEHKPLTNTLYHCLKMLRATLTHLRSPCILKICLNSLRVPKLCQQIEL
ncbi:BREX-1 system adenine-specific DNA-methyltransferase PglX [Lacticaseibacillus rhamnosus]|uniref:BREX-1 system adenine-specific DNA-methyltransferase PglX n=1 Tax=Lacticaseibacillus rhamnosus TaxID=47715 RepID=UPI003EB8D94E|nr:BREX-1 system adenine-specific DNA-methyltransferase PglX [Lacticaseibacillus rhamnosus]